MLVLEDQIKPNLSGPEDYRRSRGIDLRIMGDPTCIGLMRPFIAEHPQRWNEDIGVQAREEKGPTPSLPLAIQFRHCGQIDVSW